MANEKDSKQIMEALGKEMPKESDEIDYAWFAGILDGEGTLSIYKIKSKALKGFVPRRGFTWRIVGKVSNTNKDLMIKVQRILGKGAYHRYTPKRNRNEKDIYSIDITPLALRAVLPRCYQHLTAKKPQARLILEALDLCSLYTRRNKNNDKRLEEIFTEIRILNKRGK